MIKQNLILFRINLKIRFLCHRIIYRNSSLADSFFHIGEGKIFCLGDPVVR